MASPHSPRGRPRQAPNKCGKCRRRQCTRALRDRRTPRPTSRSRRRGWWRRWDWSKERRRSRRSRPWRWCAGRCAGRRYSAHTWSNRDRERRSHRCQSRQSSCWWWPSWCPPSGSWVGLVPSPCLKEYTSLGRPHARMAK